MTHAGITISRTVPPLPVGAGLAPSVLRIPIVRRHPRLKHSTGNRAPICEPTPTVSLSPLNATLTKYEGGPRTPNSLVVAQHAAPSTLRLPILPRATSTYPAGRKPAPCEPNPFKRNAYKNKGGVC
jgi:hypothetical protein